MTSDIERKLLKASMKIISLIVLLLLTPLHVFAEDRIGYVTDKLRLKMYSGQGEGEELATLESADRLDILEESGQFYRVRTDDGKEGWAKKFYIVDDAPAKVRLRELQDEADRHIAELESRDQQLKTQAEKIGKMEEILDSKAVGEGLRDEYEQQLIKANQENVQLFNEKEQLRKQLDQSALELKRFEYKSEDGSQYDPFKPLLWLLGTGIGGLLLGILLGWLMYARKLKKRFYGFKL